MRVPVTDSCPLLSLLYSAFYRTTFQVSEQIMRTLAQTFIKCLGPLSVDWQRNMQFSSGLRAKSRHERSQWLTSTIQANFQTHLFGEWITDSTHFLGLFLFNLVIQRTSLCSEEASKGHKRPPFSAYSLLSHTVTHCIGANTLYSQARISDQCTSCVAIWTSITS